MIPLVRGRAKSHSSGCVYAEEWSFGNYSGIMMQQTQENGAAFVDTP